MKRDRRFKAAKGSNKSKNREIKLIIKKYKGKEKVINKRN